MKHFIIPIFIPHYGCRQQCVFCNQRKITGQETTVTPALVEAIIDEHLLRITRLRYVEVAFYGGSFTALPLTLQAQLLEPAYKAMKEGKVQAIRLSTRPDFINSSIIDVLQKYEVSTVELGVQSLDQRVLDAAQRGHTVEEVVRAVDLLAQDDFQVGIQLMPGLPGEDWSSLLHTAVKASQLQASVARIYPTIVIAGTPLAQMYQDNLFRPLTMDEAVRRSAFLKIYLERHGINIIRTGLQATEELDSRASILAGPYHPAFGELVEAAVFRELLLRIVTTLSVGKDRVTVYHHSQDTSKIRGWRNENIKFVSRVCDCDIRLIPEGSRKGEISAVYNGGTYIINRNMLFLI